MFHTIPFLFSLRNFVTDSRASRSLPEQRQVAGELVDEALLAVKRHAKIPEPVPLRLGHPLARGILAGIVPLGGESRAAWSSHPGMVVPIIEQIRHDLYIAEMLLSHRNILEESFGPSLIRMREKFGFSSPAIARVSTLLDSRADDGA